jgi:hypothetical protein
LAATLEASDSWTRGGKLLEAVQFVDIEMRISVEVGMSGRIEPGMITELFERQAQGFRTLFRCPVLERKVVRGSSKWE